VLFVFVELLFEIELIPEGSELVAYCIWAAFKLKSLATTAEFECDGKHL
jgi:hypothetical protein